MNELESQVSEQVCIAFVLAENKRLRQEVAELKATMLHFSSETDLRMQVDQLERQIAALRAAGGL